MCDLLLTVPDLTAASNRCFTHQHGSFVPANNLDWTAGGSIGTQYTGRLLFHDGRDDDDVGTKYSTVSSL